jgi:hypothetical protein
VVIRCSTLSILRVGWRALNALPNGITIPGQCAFVTADNSKPKSLDLEVKLLESGQWVVKQVREFGGS